MRKILGEGDQWLRSAGRVLDFGCGSGRMIRWLHDVADSCEIWGTDISSRHIYWCKQNLSPPFHFATTTTYPHLPFPDGWFGLIYAGSVFTHIDDLADAWFLELARIIRPGGRLYVTLHDRHSAEFLEKLGRDDALFKRYLELPKYEEYVASDFAMFAIHRSIYSQVFYDIDYLCRGLEPVFRTLSVTPGAVLPPDRPPAGTGVATPTAGRSRRGRSDIPPSAPRGAIAPPDSLDTPTCPPYQAP